MEAGDHALGTTMQPSDPNILCVLFRVTHFCGLRVQAAEAFKLLERNGEQSVSQELRMQLVDVCLEAGRVNGPPLRRTHGRTGTDYQRPRFRRRMVLATYIS